MRKFFENYLEYIIMISVLTITFFIINLYVTFPRDFHKEYKGFLYDTLNEKICKEVTVKLEGKYKRDPLNEEGTFIGDIYVDDISIFRQDNKIPKKFPVGGGILDSRFSGKYYDDTIHKDLYVFLESYIDERNELVMRLYEKINSQQVTFSNRIIVAPANNSQQAKKIFKDFVVVETKYMDFDTLLKD